MHSDVLIMGGGAIGLATALELSLRGASVTVLSRNAQEAALHAAAGMLAPQAEGLLPGPMLELCLRSRALYPDWVNKLESLSGIDSEYWPCGILAPLFVKSKNSAEGPGKQWCDRPNLDALQSGLSDEVLGGWWFPQDAQVNNQKMAQALHRAVIEQGVTLREGVRVEHIDHSETQVTGIQTSEGLYQANWYVLASGAWSGELLSIPVVPRKGQMLALRTEDGQQPLQKVLFGREAYLVPRHNGRIIIGATSEDIGFTPHNTPAGVQHLLSAATRLYPPLQNWILEKCWWGFRPTTPDELPILGQSPYENLILGTGHHRNGILLTPITAVLLSEIICDRHLDPLLSNFHYQRFDH
jgi:glycine oxidase ThiO